MSEARQHLNTSDEYVSDILRLVAKALAEVYGTSYDYPKDLPDGWIGIRVDISPERLTAKPIMPPDLTLNRLLNQFINAQDTINQLEHI
ncbi:hypothetical protein [Acidithiobacillus ferrooxidans]|uniref:Uncharacterized protein n=1 Tax=Acidithiobacillus ferrooxidans TaxID=920 RepID=A0A2W1K4N1_ACIFR|nr:hypothetical protein [Acidithiobacillus ferrooxidans]MBU2816559.1 hypothetical protein [Acidithiobacillus ferrooxidans]MCR1341784.1 hypothetical protein [Acidithiobacillus ferrooxidans]PZD81816.1 hypothetical protein DN052_01700 [Acidithiobacillus ferrooxidans]QLK41891.1 hypothetical protein FE661_06790 [Acidithiobacillus ferrooxidans]QZT53854.1 hypothetical protein K7B00_06775 [Acidithiobacillus ferrooxidans]